MAMPVKLMSQLSRGGREGRGRAKREKKKGRRREKRGGDAKKKKKKR